MPSYTQTDRPLALETPLGKDVLLLTGLRGVEAVSRPFQFTLEMLNNSEQQPVSFAKLLDQAVTATLAIPGAPTRYINGIVTRLVQGPQARVADESVLIRYRAEIVPRFAMLKKRVQIRIFQQETVPAILKQVLSGLDVRFLLSAQYPARDYCVQYRESDFAFASRLMEEEGIAYYFEHSAQGHTLVVTDEATGFAGLPSQGRLAYTPALDKSGGQPRVFAWEKQQDVVSGQYTARDHCFELQEHSLEYERTLSGSVSVGAVSHELAVGKASQLTIYDYPGRYAQRFDGMTSEGQPQPDALQSIFDDGPRSVRIRLEEEAAQSLKIRGEADYGHLTPGFGFTLERHFDGDGDYILTQVEHDVNIESTYLTNVKPEIGYRNRFECIPKGLTYRPKRLTPCPYIGGTQSATVVGPKGVQVFCDKYGRVKVQFRWDLQGQKDSKSSCWLRVAQPWAGPNMGSFHLPRVGQEVVVAFEEGDPDKPIVIGSVYNSSNAPPFTLPAHAAQTGIKSSTLDGAASNFSGLGIDDTSGYEHVQLHSERHQTQSAEENLFVNVGSEHHLSIGEVHARQVGGLPLVNTFLSTAAPAKESGSGSGSGSSASSGPMSDFNWNFSVAGGKTGELLGKDTTLTFGWQMKDVLGIAQTIILGQCVNNFFNPSGVLGELASKIPGAGKVLGPGANAFFGAAATVNLGGNTVINYGPKTAILRGTSATVNSAWSGGTMAKLAKALASFYVVADVVDALLPALNPSTSTQTQRIATDTAAYLCTQALLSVWTMLEIDDEKINVLAGVKDYVEGYSDLTEQFAYLADGAGVARAVDIYTEVAGYEKPSGLSTLADLGKELAKASGAGADVLYKTLQRPEEGPSGLTIQTSGKDHCIVAPALCLWARSVAADDDAVPPVTALDASILMQTDSKGSILVQSGATTTVAGGTSTVLAMEDGDTGGSIMLDCSGADAEMALQSGPEGAKINTLILESTGVLLESTLSIAIKVGEFTLQIFDAPPGIYLGSSDTAGACLILNPEGISLSFGASKLTLSANGITLQGTNVTNSADTGYKITAPQQSNT